MQHIFTKLRTLRPATVNPRRNHGPECNRDNTRDHCASNSQRCPYPMLGPSKHLSKPLASGEACGPRAQSGIIAQQWIRTFVAIAAPAAKAIHTAPPVSPPHALVAVEPPPVQGHELLSTVAAHRQLAVLPSATQRQATSTKPLQHLSECQQKGHRDTLESKWART